MVLALLLAACGTMNAARPLAPGEHAVGATFGGPLVEFGGAAMPLPSLVLEGRHGLALVAGRPLDLAYGLNATAAAYGTAGVHAGAGWLLLEQRGALPALSVADTLYFYTNVLDATAKDRGAWLMDEVELTGSWRLGRQLLYLGAAEYLDLSDPGLLLSPFLGVELHPGQHERFALQVESRYLAVNAQPESTAIDWISLGPGALSLTLGLGWTLGRGQASSASPETP